MHPAGGRQRVRRLSTNVPPTHGLEVRVAGEGRSAIRGRRVLEASRHRGCAGRRDARTRMPLDLRRVSTTAISTRCRSKPCRFSGPLASAGRSAIRRAGSRYSTCRPAPGAAAEEGRARRQILEALARRAYRRPVTDRRCRNACWPSIEPGRMNGSFEAGIRAGARSVARRARVPVPHRARPRRGGAGQAYRLSDLELASRLSFFLWSSIPDDELLDVAEQRQARATPDVLEQQVRRMLADTRVERAGRPTSPGSGCTSATCAACRRTRRCFPSSTRTCARRAAARDRAVPRESAARGPQRPRSADGGLHVPERTARQSLRHSERLRQPLPARDAERSTSARACSATASILTVTSYADPDVAGAARQVAARKHPRCAAAAAAAERPGAEGERPGP